MTSVVEHRETVDRSLPDWKYVRPRAPLAVAFASLATGVLVDRWLSQSQASLGVEAWWALACAALLAWLSAWLWRWRIALALLLASAAALGGLWHHACWNVFDAEHLVRAATVQRQAVALRVLATSGPRYEPAPAFDPLRPVTGQERTRLTVRVLSARDRQVWKPASGLATLTVSGRLEGIEAGDTLQVFGHLSRPGPPLNPGAFDFADYYRADRLLLRLSTDHAACVQRLPDPRRWRPWSLVQRLRSAGDRVLWRHLHRERSGLAAALLLGLREELPDERAQAFVVTGTIHLLVVSGMHVSIVVALLVWAHRGGLLPRRAALLTTALLGVGYTLVTNAEPPAVRAAVMIVLLCWGWYLRRPQAAWNALAGAALWVLAVNPADLFRTGPQLSFLCVATLLALDGAFQRRPPADPLDRLIYNTRPWQVRLARRVLTAAAQATLVSAAVWSVTAPLLLARFHLCSPVTVMLSPLLAAPVAAALVSGLLLVVLSWLPPAAWLCAGVCDVNLRLTEWTVERAAQLPLNHLWAPGPTHWWLLGFYGLLAAWLYWRPRFPRRWLLALLCGWATLGLVAGSLTRRGGELRCTFLSVGHGLAVVIELPQGETILYDAGQLGSPHRAADAVAGYLWQRGRRNVDGLIVSHADADHFNGVPELLERVAVRAAYASPQTLRESGGAAQALRSACAAHDVLPQAIWAGDRLRIRGDVELRVLHPRPEDIAGRDNAHSVTLLVEYQGRRILLTGDLETPGLETFLEQPPVDCDVILAPHHGSPRSDPPGLLAWSKPEWVVISGEHRPAGERVRRAYANAGARVLTTGRDGAVTATIRQGKLTVQTFCSGSAP